MTSDPRNIPAEVQDSSCDRVLGEDVQGAVDNELAFELELAAAAASAAMLSAQEQAPMPRELANTIRARLADPALHAERPGAGGAAQASREDEPTEPRLWLGQLGWFAAVAAILLAAFAWFLPIGESSQGSPRALYARLSAASTSQRADWSVWPTNEDNPNAEPVTFADGVSGEVIWNEPAQQGVMVFEGLPANDPSAEQYQLWIIVPDQKHPIDGGVFDMADSSGGKVYVPIDPKLAVHDAVAFAITIEKPGGVVVSDQDRRVVVAAPTKS
ncbi:MAG: anti-sigma factor [Phycisphaerales bacterium]|nr:anti-sigma factor [Phycisphaerales bacterium]